MYYILSHSLPMQFRRLKKTFFRYFLLKNNRKNGNISILSSMYYLDLFSVVENNNIKFLENNISLGRYFSFFIEFSLKILLFFFINFLDNFFFFPLKIVLF